MWINQLAHGQDASVFDTYGNRTYPARRKGSPEQIAHWGVHQPIVTALIQNASVLVACDPERSTYEPGQLAIIWGWVVTDERYVYGAGIKHDARKADIATDIARDLLGARLGGTTRTALDLVDLARLKLIPAGWKRDRDWGKSLREVSARLVETDAMHTLIARHIVDPTRPRWVPKEQRAA